LYRSLDISTMLRALRVPKEKLTVDGIHAAGLHFTTLQNRSAADLDNLKESLARFMAQMCNLETLVPTPWIDSVSHSPRGAQEQFPEPDHGRTYSGFLATSGGVLHGSITLDDELRISSAKIAGNVYVMPHHLFKKIQSVWYGASEGEISQRMESLLYDL
ncbi:lipoate--protein ligase, partial [Acidithiobacillus ferrooxidans]|nr:lipoate--protein ligase [Acidithiobacillus ferrooxidans]